MPEVAVVGGGAVGLAAAALLARSKFRVAIVEPRPLPPDAPGPEPDARVLALTPASRKILQACGTWDRMDAARIAPWIRMRVWERDDANGIEFKASDINQAELGCIVENPALIRALHQVLQESGAEFHNPDSVAHLETDASGIELALESGERLRVEAVVAADGARSKVRELAGLEWDFTPHRQQAIAAEVETAQPYEPTAWQRFRADGTVALLPLFNERYSLVWSSMQADELMQQPEEGFAESLTAALGGRLGAVRLCGPRSLFPLGRGFAPQWCAPGIALIGDAAHVVHPLAGLGQNLGLMDAAVLQEEMAGHPLSQRALQAYERRRKGLARMTQWALEGFRVGFGLESEAASRLRSHALGLAGYSRTVRRLFIRQADGCLDAPRWLSASAPFEGRVRGNRAVSQIN